jgi:murein L,D-transpeptidase YcbB/YkuD
MLIIFLLGVVLMPAGTCLARTFDDAVAVIIHQKLGGAKIAGRLNVGTCQISSLSVIPALYNRRQYHPIWVNAGSVEQLIRAIEEMYRDGLDPEDYHLDEIRQQWSVVCSAKAPDPSLAASLDLLLTDAFIRLANHSNCGKQDPLTYHPQWNLDRKISDTDPVVFIEQAIASPSLEETFNTWKISHPFYSRLKTALAAYRVIRDSGGWDAVPPGPALKKGMTGPRVSTLRKRLAITSDLQESAADPLTFDEGLQDAVIHFQKRHGLNEDGVVGKETLAALNVPVEDRIDQIRVNLERARWVLRDPGDTFVLVDIAGFRVFFNKENKIIWSCRAQVGQPYRDTPVFRSKITHVEFNPAWVVPPTILNKDILPAVRKDPAYLNKKGIMILDRRGAAVSPNTVNWSLYPGRPFPYTLRQNPGAENALGRIKIIFPNPYSVYMHDTPHKELFANEDRTFSSGCIRLEKPFELAELLLDDPVRWNSEGIMEAVDSGKTRIVKLPRPVTILLLYVTVEVDKDGIVFFKRDPYNRDRAVLEGLGRDSGIRHIVITGAE